MAQRMARVARGLGLVGVFLAGERGAAQSPPVASSPVPGRLTVRPHTMATGTRNARAGEQTLDSLDGYLVYVPEQAVGTKRMPLAVVVHGGGGSAAEQLERHRSLADKYGMILLLGTSVMPGRWDVIDYYANGQLTTDPTNSLVVREMPDNQDERNVDAAMRQVLRQYAIDPDQIGLLGMSDGGAYALYLGLNNLDVFSRVASMSPSIPFRGAGPGNQQHKTTQFFLLGGIAEEGFFQSSLFAARELRQDGHSVKQAVILRPHQQRAEDYDQIFRWLQASWAPTGTAAPTAAPIVAADSLAPLTSDALGKMTAFWAAFTREPDSIRSTARRATQQQIMVPVGQRHLSLTMADIPALAAKYPSVAADLEAAGLTAQQEEAYRIALISAKASGIADDDFIGGPLDTVPAGSILGKNVAFLDEHQTELEALDATRMWIIP